MKNQSELSKVLNGMESLSFLKAIKKGDRANLESLAAENKELFNSLLTEKYNNIMHGIHYAARAGKKDSVAFF